MTEFFTPVEFPSKASSVDQKPKTKVEWDPHYLASARTSIDKECQRIRVGTSKLVAGAVDNGKFKTPAETAIITFLDDPSDELFQRVKELTVQDYGQRAGDYFVSLLKKARREVSDE